MFLRSSLCWFSRLLSEGAGELILCLTRGRTFKLKKQKKQDQDGAKVESIRNMKINP